MNNRPPLIVAAMGLSLLSQQIDLYALHWQLPAELLDAWVQFPVVGIQGDFVLDVQTLQLPSDKLFPSQAGRASGLAKRRTAN